MAGRSEESSARRHPVLKPYPKAGVIDAHAHQFPAELPNLSTGDGRPWPSLVVGEREDGTVSGRIMLGQTVFRAVREPLWDVGRRIEELDRTGVSMQIISPTPILLTYWAEPREAAVYAQAVNDSIAADVAASGGRLVGLGTVPMQDPKLAVAELTRLRNELGLAGVELGTCVGESELDDPVFADFWSAAADLDASIFIHPLDGGGGSIRRRGQPYDFGLGMLTDTAIAATALICGGVLDSHPDLRVALAHGCGSFAWVYPRLRMATRFTDDKSLFDRFEGLTRRLWVDTLVFDAEHLRLLVMRFGGDHVMFGTDYPFIAGQLEGARSFLEEATSRGSVTVGECESILSSNGYGFLPSEQSNALTGHS